MNLRDCYIEEDLFPKIFTDYEERESARQDAQYWENSKDRQIKD